MNQPAHAVNNALESPGGKLAWAIAKIVLSLTLTALMTVATSYLKDISKKVDEQISSNVRQDLNIQSLQQLTQSQQRVIDANSTAMRTVGEQVLRNTDAIEHLKDMQLQRIQQSRPRR